MKFRDFMKKRNPHMTLEEIDEDVKNLWGGDAEMGEPVEENDHYTLYSINGYQLVVQHNVPVLNSEKR